MKKIGGVFVIACALLLSVYYVSAIDLVVSSSAIQNSYIIDIDEHALYELIITNNGEPGTFEIYSLVGVDISPKNFYLAKGVKGEVWPYPKEKIDDVMMPAE